MCSIAAAVSFAVVGSSVGCGNTSCETLDPLCADCMDHDYAVSCRNAVDRNILEVCDAALADYERVCVLPDAGTGGATTTTSTGAGGADGGVDGG
jgi:hypothetical protein